MIPWHREIRARKLNQNIFYILTLYDVVALRDWSEKTESERFLHSDILALYDIAAMRDSNEETESEQLLHTDILTLYDIAALRDSREEVESEQLLLADVCRLPVRSGVTHIKRDP